MCAAVHLYSIKNINEIAEEFDDLGLFLYLNAVYFRLMFKWEKEVMAFQLYQVVNNLVDFHR